MSVLIYVTVVTVWAGGSAWPHSLVLDIRDQSLKGQKALDKEKCAVSP